MANPITPKPLTSAERAEAGRELERREFAARRAEMQVALDQMQTAVTQARAERDAARDDAAQLRRDINGFVEEIRDLNDQLAAEKTRADAAELAQEAGQ